MPIYVGTNYSVDRSAARTHIKARKTAPARGKIPTIAAVASTAVAPWLNPLLVLILLNFNLLSLFYHRHPIIVVFFSVKETFERMKK